MREATLKQALLGERREAEIWRLLLQSGADTTMEYATRPIPEGGAKLEFAPEESIADPRPTLTKEEYQTLMAPLWNYQTRSRRVFARSQGLPDNLFDRLLRRAAASGKRVPDNFLYNFAEATCGKRLSTRRLSLLIGRFGRWLNETDKTREFRDLSPVLLPLEILEPSPDEREATRFWLERPTDENERASAERLATFELIYARDSERALRILQENWAEVKRDRLNSYLSALKDDLGEKAIETLQDLERRLPNWACYSDELLILRDLLARTPTSRYANISLGNAEYILTRLDEFVSLKERPNDDEEDDDEIEEQEEEEAETEEEERYKPDKSEICQTLGHIPLARWEEIVSASPQEIRDFFLATNERATFVEAQLRSFALFGGSDEWFEICCEAFPEVYNAPKKSAPKESDDSTARQTPELFLKKVLETGRVDYFKRLFAIWNSGFESLGKRVPFESRILRTALQFCPYPWSEELARAFCEKLIEQIKSNEEEESQSASELFPPLIGYCPRAIREEFREFATKGDDEFKPTEEFAEAYSNVCAWRERFDRLFGSPEQD